MTENSAKELKRKIKVYIGILLLGAVFGLGIYYGVTVSTAAPVTVGTINTGGSSLRVRSGPGTNYSAIGALNDGGQVTILGEENDWYKIQYGTQVGYVLKRLISNVHTTDGTQSPPPADGGAQVPPGDAAYRDSLVAAGFPASYANLLSGLHSQYPNWVFEPVLTGLDWNTVLTEEGKLGRNLVQSVNNDAQKSTAAGAYDWLTNSWIGFDTASWVCASPEMIAYCMDPRNFLDADSIFQFATSEFQEYQNAAGVLALVSGSFLTGNYSDTDGATRSYPETFVEVGRQVAVSPYHLAARCRQEQGKNGTSGSISGTEKGYEGYFNYFNVGAYATNGLTPVQKGLQYAKGQGWNSRYKAILGGASVVGNNYVKKGQNTVYFEKFNVVNKASGLYAHQYMTNVQAAISEGRNTKKAYTDTNASIVFRIPVYNNMPETSSLLPQSGNPNNWLKSLSVNGYNLTPGFSPATTEYTLIVGQEVSAVEISASAVAGTSSVSGTGTVSLNYGNNGVAITCTAQNGSPRTYTINIVRQQPPSGGGSRGDVNGDGTINLADWVTIKRHILGIESLSGERFQAADVNGDGTVNLADWVAVKRHILGYESLN